jgi:hypothetical protein
MKSNGKRNNDDLEYPKNAVDGDEDVAQPWKEGLSVIKLSMVLLSPEEDDKGKHGEADCKTELVCRICHIGAQMGDREAEIDDS